METIKLSGPCSTVAVMEYIRDHGYQPSREYGNMHFIFPDDQHNSYIMGIPVGMQPSRMIVSEQDTHYWFFPKLHPLEEWHDVFGMKRIQCNHSERAWYVYINGKYYYMDC